MEITKTVGELIKHYRTPDMEEYFEKSFAETVHDVMWGDLASGLTAYAKNGAGNAEWYIFQVGEKYFGISCIEIGGAEETCEEGIDTSDFKPDTVLKVTEFKKVIKETYESINNG